MRLPDVNVLVNAVNSAAREHEVAKAWLSAAFDSPAGVLLAWAAMLGFVRISTHHKILPKPLGVQESLVAVRNWITAPRARIAQPTPQHGPLLASLLLQVGTAGNLTTDAHLAALAIEHGATLGSFDGDFERFRGLRFERLRA